MTDDKRTEGPKIRGSTRLDIVEDADGFRLDFVADGVASMPLSKPMSPKEMRRVITTLSGALRKATKHLRDPTEEWRNLQAFLAEIEEDYAKPDYPRESLVAEVAELRAEVRLLRGETVH
jgi:hypothetical protein